MSNDSPARPAFFLEEAADAFGERAVVVGGLERGFVDCVRMDHQAVELLREAFEVAVAVDPAGDLPPVSGSYELGRESIRFVPDVPFDPGVSFRARFDPQRYGRLDLDPLQFEFAVPRVASAGRPFVSAIYPSADVLPENILRFYVCFSAPMARGGARYSVAILDAAGAVVPDVLYQAPVELWDPGMQRLTIWLDPGRLKRGLGPNRELGPPLRSGERYRLVVADGFSDALGDLLIPAFKEFEVSAPVREAIDPNAWLLAKPMAGTRQPLVLTFPRALDWANAGDSLVVALGERRLHGSAAVGEDERGWWFVPDELWCEGSYSVMVRTGLEDVCGNRVGAAFDRQVRPGVELQAEDSARFIPFELS